MRRSVLTTRSETEKNSQRRHSFMPEVDQAGQSNYGQKLASLA
jgi:hypothetical protein